MLEGLPIMLALCFMLWHAYYAQNYAGIIDAALACYIHQTKFHAIYLHRWIQHVEIVQYYKCNQITWQYRQSIGSVVDLYT